MHTHALERYQHSHTFGQEAVRAAERRTLVVVAVTAAMMVVEIAAGLAFGSMALLADGLHMGSHAVALGISAAAYLYARRHAADASFAFGTGKVNSLAGFTGALLLAVFAVMMGWESGLRLVNPLPIAFDQAIAVALAGLLVNGASVFILEGGGRDHSHDHDHDHGHEHDHNLRSAYLHVLADALTSLLAIVALLSAKVAGLTWMDPAMGIVGALLVSRWSWALLRQTTAVLLDQQAPENLRAAVRAAIEGERDDRVADLHVWAIAPGLHAAIIAVVTHEPRPADDYKRRLPAHLGLAHVTIEVHHCA